MYIKKNHAAFNDYQVTTPYGTLYMKVQAINKFNRHQRRQNFNKSLDN